MTDPDLPPLDGDIRALVRRAARVEPAPGEARARVLDRVERVVGRPGGPGGGGGSGGEPGPVDSSAARAPTRLVQRLLPLAASFALGGGVTALALHRAPAAPMPVEPPRIIDVERPPAAGPMAEPTAARNEPDASPPPLAIAPASPPARAPASAVAPPSPSRDQLTAERQLLDVARSALEREEPEAALEATKAHERTFPKGALVQEREAMAIRALVLLGRTDEARTRAERFRARFPESLLLPTIESTVGSARLP